MAAVIDKDFVVSGTDIYRMPVEVFRDLNPSTSSNNSQYQLRGQEHADQSVLSSTQAMVSYNQDRKSLGEGDCRVRVRIWKTQASEAANIGREELADGAKAQAGH